MNIITIAGVIGRDAELKTIGSGDQISNFSVADSQGREKPSIWWRCSLFGKRAASLNSYLSKGTSVTVTGQITEREYTNKEGVAVKAMEIRVNDVALQGGNRSMSPTPPAKTAAAPAKAASGFDEMDDDIPW